MKEIVETYDADFVLPSLYIHLAAAFGPVATALEIPCSGGTGLLYLRRFADSVIGADISDEHVEWARHRVAQQVDIRVTITDMADVDEAHASDLVLVPREGLQFISTMRDPRDLLRSLARVVRPGGRLVLDCFDFRSATTASETETPRYFRPGRCSPVASTAVLRCTSGRLLRRHTVLDSLSTDPIAFTSSYELDGNIAHRDFTMTHYEPTFRAARDVDTLALETVARGFDPDGTPGHGDTGRRIVVFQKSA